MDYQALLLTLLLFFSFNSQGLHGINGLAATPGAYRSLRLQTYPSRSNLAAYEHQQQPSSSSKLSPYDRLRKLLRGKQSGANSTNSIPDVPQCTWNDIREACSPSQLVYLAIDAAPKAVFHKAAALAYDRNLVCSGHVDAVRCNGDVANRCMYWSASCVGADAYELVNWNAGGVLNGQATMEAFTCSGTAAASYRICRTAAEAGPKGICNQLPGCHWANGTCLPTIWQSKTSKQLQELKAGFDSFAVAVWGSCPEACYVRQAANCQKSYNISTNCLEKPYCTWEYDVIDKRKVCEHKDTVAKGKDAFSQAYYKILVDCNKAATQEACEQPRVVPKNIARYRSATSAQLAQEQTIRCNL